MDQNRMAVRPLSPPAEMAWEWDERKLRAVMLLVDGKWSDLEVAEAVHVHVDIIHSWKANPTFALKIKEILKGIEERLFQGTICNKVKRLQSMVERYEGMKQIIRERAACHSFDTIPGGRAGLFEWVKGRARYDHLFAREMRELEKQIAIEMGQYIMKMDATTQHNEVVVLKLGLGMSMDDLG